MAKDKIAVIMQPTYLPWIGYFNLIYQADVLIFLDDVQFSPRSWQQRNRLLVNGKSHWLTVPAHKVGEPELIYRVRIVDETPWRRKHTRLLERCYAHHPCFETLEPIIEILQDTSLTLLADLNIRIIRCLCDGLGLSADLRRSSEIPVTGSRSEVLIKLCQKVGCTVYLSPAGSAGYLAEDGLFERSPVRLTFQEFEPREYPQKGSREFVSHLSTLDLLANVGYEGAREYVR